jgi:LysM repeat protein
VQAGDTLSGIAAELGTTVEDLVATNGIEDPNLLYAGETLRYYRSQHRSLNLKAWLP